MTVDELLAVARQRGLAVTLGPAPALGIPGRPSGDDDEETFTRRVIAFAQEHGWRAIHLRPARTASGWRTAVSGNGKGFPDLLLVRGEELLVAELKVGKNRPTPEQRTWLAAFAAAGVRAYTWRPTDWMAIEKALT
ncbi:MAG TPA: VRR-NUC domain-containing protein [Gemmataceae bacterium]|nr:VRR-NUC domain-containing protein [Gemmataceae bacterium]